MKTMDNAKYNKKITPFASLPNCFFSRIDNKKGNYEQRSNRSLPKLDLLHLENTSIRNKIDAYLNGSHESSMASNIAGITNNHTQNDSCNVPKDLTPALDIHAITNVPNLHSLEVNVEDCLTDLDNYLETIDSYSLSQENLALKNLDTRPTMKQQFTRRQNRSVPIIKRKEKTINCSKEKKYEDFLEKHLKTPLKKEPILAMSENSCLEHITDESKCSNSSESNSFQPLLKKTTQSALNSEIRRCFSQSRLNGTPIRKGILTEDDIFNNILLQNDVNSNLGSRPRQFGRRAEGLPQILSVRSDVSNRSGHFTIINHTQRPYSAPATSASQMRNDTNDENHLTFSVNSELSSPQSSGHSSPITVISSSDSCSISPSLNGNTQLNLTTNTQIADLNSENMISDVHVGVNEWPHSCSRALALVSCTLGLFNMCRFAVLTIQYGGNFVLQFIILSILFGIPLFLLNMCLGSKIKAGPISMWKISPICRGIGIALVTVQSFIAIYSAVAIAWLFFYLRDSILIKSSSSENIIKKFQRNMNNTSSAEGVSDYFNIEVLQRFQLLKPTDTANFRINSWMAFNLAVIWAIVFVILCKGIRSLGKAVFVLTIFPLSILVAVVCKLLYIVDPAKLQNIFVTADFDNFLMNSKTWIAASQEVFITWGLLGASVISMTSHSYVAAQSHFSLRRDAIFAVLITVFGLCVAALLGTCCIQILNQHAFIYSPGSFENLESSRAIYSIEVLTNASVLSFPPKWMHHYSTFIGETYRRRYSPHESGYQALRLITEIFPAIVILSQNNISYVWPVITFIAFIMLGISQLSAMWKPIVSSLENSISSVFLCCVTALSLGIPFTTEIGIYVFHYFDFVLGGSWFVAILWIAQIFGVFLIRGRPYNGDDLVYNLKMSASLSAFTALSWNVLLPIGLITLSIVNYKTSFSNQFYNWRGKSYFNYWTRKVAASIQIGFIIIIPVTAIVQIYRYLFYLSTPSDILDRFQLLYRPDEDLNRFNTTNYDGGSDSNHNGRIEIIPHNDSPPKYTPPPSYSTATGAAHFAKMLRQSIRRSIRRILCERGELEPVTSTNTDQRNSCESNTIDFNLGVELDEPSTSSNTQRSFSLGYTFLGRPQKRRNDLHMSGRNHGLQRPFTANDVVAVLRSSTAWGRRTVSASTSRGLRELHAQNDMAFHSIDNLITNAAALDQSTAVAIGFDEDRSRASDRQESRIGNIQNNVYEA